MPRKVAKKKSQYISVPTYTLPSSSRHHAASCIITSSPPPPPSLPSFVEGMVARHAHGAEGMGRSRSAAAACPRLPPELDPQLSTVLDRPARRSAHHNAPSSSSSSSGRAHMPAPPPGGRESCGANTIFLLLWRSAAVAYDFREAGTSITPPHTYGDFAFTDYAPMAFLRSKRP